MIEIRNQRGAVIYVYSHGHGTDFDGADLSGLDLTGAVLEGAVFSDARLSGTNLEKADLYWANFFHADLTGANLRHAILRGCDMKCALLANADLRGADLGPDNVGGSTQLQGADLSGCLIEGTRFQNAAYDRTTILPAGLDPERHGMIFIEPD